MEVGTRVKLKVDCGPVKAGEKATVRLSDDGRCALEVTSGECAGMMLAWIEEDKLEKAEN